MRIKGDYNTFGESPSIFGALRLLTKSYRIKHQLRRQISGGVGTLGEPSSPWLFLTHFLEFNPLIPENKIKACTHGIKTRPALPITLEILRLPPHLSNFGHMTMLAYKIGVTHSFIKKFSSFSAHVGY
ncbi:hypothetical protein H5410_030734 [Solanum commersonii]|uniref:Uncharacterized protein n=1 Tax=Solanum commersonii TaxID=4109 RepID=A0A9J5YJK7_SOLCO|nr:hypothetical protein H5410_030734 [Solanum commersonii]